MDIAQMSTDYVAGYVHDVGPGVTRFKKGDRVLSVSAAAVRNDHRFGAHQRFTLSTELLTAHVSYLDAIPPPETDMLTRVRLAIRLLRRRHLQPACMLPCLR